MSRAVYVIPGVLFVTAAVCFGVTLGPAVLDDRSIGAPEILGALDAFIAWVPAVLVAASVYVLAEKTAAAVDGGAGAARPSLSALVVISAVSALFALSARSLLAPVVTRALSDTAAAGFAAPDHTGNMTDNDDVTADTPLPYSAPIPVRVDDVDHTDDIGTRDFDAPALSDFSADALILEVSTAEREERWFDAHYYAQTGLAQIPPDDPRAPGLAASAKNAWARLEATEAYVDAKARAFFLKKREGYGDLIAGKLLDAYGIFADLDSTNPNDPDVERYYRVAADQVKATYYFTDEIPDFSGTNSGTMGTTGTKNAVRPFFFARTDDAGRTHLYYGDDLYRTDGTIGFARNFTSLTYGADGLFLTGFTAPFAKLVTIPAAAVGAEDRREFALTPGTDVLLVMVTGVSRGIGCIDYTPEYRSSDSAPNPVERPIVYLKVTLEDLFRVSDAVHGPGEMALPSLWSFVVQASRFAFPVDYYFLALLDFAALPFMVTFLVALFFLGALKSGFADAPASKGGACLFLALAVPASHAAFTAAAVVNNLVAILLVHSWPLPIAAALLLGYHLVLIAVCLAELLKR